MRIIGTQWVLSRLKEATWVSVATNGNQLGVIGDN